MDNALKDLAQPIGRVHIRHRIGPLNIEVDFQLTRRWTILFGPSGSGKSTILRILAGLISPDEAQFYIGSGLSKRLLTDTRTRTWVSSHQRNIGFVSQQSTLFPHLSVRQNIAFGVRVGSIASTTEQDAVREALDRFRLDELCHAMPASISGGEQRRVAIARAVTFARCMRRGSLLLLDEPFTGLDLRLRDQLIAELKPVAEEVPVLSVTHDLTEAFLLGAEVIKLADGRVVAQGSAEQVLSEERDRFLTQLRTEI